MAVRDFDLTDDRRGTTIADIARRFLAEGAGPTDHVRVFRNGRLSVTGVIGRLTETEAGNGAEPSEAERYEARGEAPGGDR